MLKRMELALLGLVAKPAAAVATNALAENPSTQGERSVKVGASGEDSEAPVAEVAPAVALGCSSSGGTAPLGGLVLLLAIWLKLRRELPSLFRSAARPLSARRVAPPGMRP